MTDEDSTAAIEQAKQTALLDGGEWSTLQAWLIQQGRLPADTMTPWGQVSISTGTKRDSSDQNSRYVGLVADTEKGSWHSTSLAKIPTDRCSVEDAMSTYLTVLTTVVPILPRIDGIGGSKESLKVIAGKAVLLGGNDLSCFVAKALTALGVDVCLVSNNGGLNADRIQGTAASRNKRGTREYTMLVSVLDTTYFLAMIFCK